MRRILAIAAATLALATLGACGGDARGSGGPDRGADVGGRDAGSRDSGVSDGAGHDAAPDAEADGAGRPEDAAGDASPDGSGSGDDSGPDAPGDAGDSGSDGADPDPPVDAVDDPLDGSTDTGPVACAWSKGPSDDADRMVLVGHPFSDTPGVPGTTIRRMTLTASRTLIDESDVLDVGFRPARIAIAPSGTLAFVLGERGELASVRLADALEVVDSIALGSASYGELHVLAEQGLLHVVGFNSTADSGIGVVAVDCDGNLEERRESFFSLRLSASLAPVGEGLAVLVGGQAVFDPVDPHDIRLLRRLGDGWEQVASFDVYGDMIQTGRIAATPNGDRVLVPNGSPFSTEGHTVAVLAVSAGSVAELHRLGDMADASEALVSVDGLTALVSLVEPGRIVVLRRTAEGRFEEVRRIAGIGLPDQMAHVERGALSGTVLIPSIDPSGVSNIAILTIDGPGAVTDRGQYDFGSGVAMIPDAIAVTP